MNTNRRIAVVAGVAFLIATIAQMVGVALVSPILGAPNYLAEISANEDRVLFGALFQFIGGVACTGIALALYPVLRMHNHGLAMGSVGFRTIEGVFHGLIRWDASPRAGLASGSAQSRRPEFGPRVTASRARVEG